MAVSKSIKIGDSSKDREGRIRVRSEAASAIAASRSASEVTEVTVAKASFLMLREHKGSMRKLLTSYAAAASKAERLGHPVDMIITVKPKAEPAIVARAARGDALDQALAAGRVRGTIRVADILKSSDMVTAREFATLIGASHETVNQKRKTGEVLALAGATRGLRYPKWQVTPDGRPLPGLADLFRALGGHPWTVYRFLLQRHAELGGGTALDALKRNRVEQALAAARNLSEGTFA